MNEQEQYETELAEMMLDQHVEQYNELRAESIYRLLKKAGVQRVLDVGCGLGKVTIYLAQRGIDITGIDVSHRLIELARKKSAEKHVPTDFHVVELGAFQTKQKYDAVLFAGVLEHIDDDEQLMRDAYRFLNKHGKIIITAPCFPFLYNPRDKRIGHLRRYTKKSIARKLIQAGYVPVIQRYYSFAMIFGAIYLKIFKKNEYPFNAVNSITDKFLHVWYKYLENNFIFPIGEHLYVIGQRKD
jgi:2-polyprenyl-3-methyl-5-hydroxy-6-metoxy-1,4-benzoquinol methylase